MKLYYNRVGKEGGEDNNNIDRLKTRDNFCHEQAELTTTNTVLSILARGRGEISRNLVKISGHAVARDADNHNGIVNTTHAVFITLDHRI